MPPDDQPPDALRDRNAAAADSAAISPSPDVIFRALAAAPRRRLLVLLLSARESTVPELATELAGWEATETGPVGPSQLEAITVQLRHVHLPQLSASNLIEYDPAAGTVALANVGDPVRDLITVAREYERKTDTTEQ